MRTCYDSLPPTTPSQTLAVRLYVVRLKHHVMFFPPSITDPFSLTFVRPVRPPRQVCALRLHREPPGVQQQQQQSLGVCSFTTYVALTLLFCSPLQQVQTCVWDVSSPFRIVLVNASKVNAEETAKVYAHSVRMKKT